MGTTTARRARLGGAGSRGRSGAWTARTHSPRRAALSPTPAGAKISFGAVHRGRPRRRPHLSTPGSRHRPQTAPLESTAGPQGRPQVGTEPAPTAGEEVRQTPCAAAIAGDRTCSHRSGRRGRKGRGDPGRTAPTRLRWTVRRPAFRTWAACRSGSTVDEVLGTRGPGRAERRASTRWPAGYDRVEPQPAHTRGPSNSYLEGPRRVCPPVVSNLGRVRAPPRRGSWRRSPATGAHVSGTAPPSPAQRRRTAGRPDRAGG